MPESKPVTLSESKKLCTSPECPQCHAFQHISVEQTLIGEDIITRCHCRTCGHSWHPVTQ